MDPATIVSIVEGLIDVILKLVSYSDAKQLLDDAAVKRANEIADIAEAAKLVSQK